MVQRQALTQTVFEDEESVRRYAQGINQWMPRVAKSFAAIVRSWQMTPGKALDVGCGTGILASELAIAFPELEFVGLDLSEAALTVAREHAAQTEVVSRVSFQQGDAEDMPFEDESFDLVVSSNTLHLLKNPVRMFDEIHRVLTPGGRFIVSDFRRSWLGYFTQHIRAAYSPREIEQLLGQSKLENWSVRDGFLWLTALSRS